MSNETRSRLIAVIVILVVIPLGIFARSHRSGADPSTLLGFLATYAGDTLWPIMFYFFGRFCLPRASRLTLVVLALSITLTLEFGQLWNPPFLLWLRQQPIIGFILGNTFIWSDVWCCAIGTFSAALIDFLLAARSGSLGVSE